MKTMTRNFHFFALNTKETFALLNEQRHTNSGRNPLRLLQYMHEKQSNSTVVLLCGLLEIVRLECDVFLGCSRCRLWYRNHSRMIFVNCPLTVYEFESDPKTRKTVHYQIHAGRNESTFLTDKYIYKCS